MMLLCDTSTILLVLRIAPAMFSDPGFECATIPEVREEVFRTQKFKERYPWRTQYIASIRPLPFSVYKTEAFRKNLLSIESLLGVGIVNVSTGKLFTLSPEDCALLACALANDYLISSGDRNLVEFAYQEFPDIFRGNLSALEVVNRWLESGAITWDDARQAVVADWKAKQEAPQPRMAVRDFERLTQRNYPGP